MAAIVYPAALPGPQSAPLTPAERRALSDGAGPLQVRSRQRDFRGQQQLEFVMTAQQVASFHAWWADDLTYGGARFAASDWPTLQGYTGGVYRFMEPSRWEHLARGIQRLRIAVEVWGRGEVPTTLELDPLTRLQSYFDGNSTDISVWANGAGVLSGATISDGALRVNNTSATAHNLIYEGTPFAGDGVRAITVEFFSTFGSNPNVSYMPNFSYQSNTLDSATAHRFGYLESAGRMVYDDAGFGTQYESPGPVLGRTHCALVFGSGSRRAYINGALVHEQIGPSIPPGGLTARVTVGQFIGYSSVIASSFTIDSFRVRAEEVYTGGSFVPPTELPGPFL